MAPPSCDDRRLPALGGRELHSRGRTRQGAGKGGLAQLSALAAHCSYMPHPPLAQVQLSTNLLPWRCSLPPSNSSSWHHSGLPCCLAHL